MDDLLDRCREQVGAGAQVDDILRFLRDAGVSRIWSMDVLVRLYGMDLATAKAAVHLSPVWADLVRARTDSTRRWPNPGQGPPVIRPRSIKLRRYRRLISREDAPTAAPLSQVLIPDLSPGVRPAVLLKIVGISTMAVGLWALVWGLRHFDEPPIPHGFIATRAASNRAAS